jgi:hypothetical protein
MTRLLSAAFTAMLLVGLLAETTLAQTKSFSPARGDAEIGVLAPVTKVEKDMVITTIKVKNLMPNSSIAGLKVEEFWWDKTDNPVTGSKARVTKPLLPGEVATLTLQTPKDPKMFRNSYQFTHANGKVKTKPMKAF